ncbi:hypothetical protein MT391_05315 [Vibrio sp. 1-Bac 57]
MTLITSLVEFRQNVTKVNSYIELAYEQDSSSNNLRTGEEIEFLVTSAFLKLFIAWESFLEKSFISYLTGEESLDGNQLVRYASPVDEKHAHRILIGTQNYVAWSNNEIVNKIAGLYFENSEPYLTALNSISRDLSDLRVIRNASAHISSSTQTKLDAVASRVLGTPISNIGVSDLVTRISPEDNTKTILQMYQLKLDISAENIAHNRT